MSNNILTVSIVIPVYREALLELMLSQLVTQMDASVIDVVVVDASPEGERYVPSDAVLAAFSDNHVLLRVVYEQPGRGAQLRAGAAMAVGEVLWFLHADSVVPNNGPSQILRAVEAGAGAGAFRLAFDAPGFYFKWIAWWANLRSRLTRVPFGDQGIFVVRSVLESVGGIPDVPLMEDVILMKTLRRRGVRIVLLESVVKTSARRYLTGGKWRTTFRNLWVQLLFKCGGSPDTLYRRYYAR